MMHHDTITGTSPRSVIFEAQKELVNVSLTNSKVFSQDLQTKLQTEESPYLEALTKCLDDESMSCQKEWKSKD